MLTRTPEKLNPLASGFQETRRDERLIILLDDPRAPAPFDITDWAAWRSMDMGVASPEQQIRAMEHMAVYVCDFNGDPFRPDPYLAAYQAGKRSVFAQIKKIIDFMPPDKVRANGGEQGA